VSCQHLEKPSPGLPLPRPLSRRPRAEEWDEDAEVVAAGFGLEREELARLASQRRLAGRDWEDHGDGMMARGRLCLECQRRRGKGGSGWAEAGKRGFGRDLRGSERHLLCLALSTGRVVSYQG